MATYVGLGDSYAAGVGGGPSTDECRRTTDGYPVQVAQALGVSLAYQACIGATVADVRAQQLGALGDDTAYVSITVGGNDLDFTTVLTEFAMPAWMADESVLDTALRTLRDDLPGRYAQLFADVRERVPKAQVVVAGYPRLFDGVDCSLLTFFSDDEMSRLNDAADELATVMDRATTDAGFTFVDVRGPFEGHAVCDDPAWIHDVTWPVEESFHPTAAGHTAYGRHVAEALGASAAHAAIRPVGAGAWPVPTDCGPCRTTPPPTFRPPDLTSRRSLDGARRHGLDVDEVAELGRRLNGGGADPQAYDRACHLDRRVRESSSGEDLRR